MRKWVTILLLVVAAASAHANVIGNFEGASLDNWVAGWEGSPVLANSQTPGTVTLDESSMSVITNGGYFCLQWNAPSVPASLYKLTFDLSMIQSEWPATPWTKVAEKIAINSDGASGWMEFADATAEWRDGSGTAPLDWGAWDPDAAKTFTVDISSYDPTGATYLQIIMTLQGGDNTGAFYFDNVQLVDVPQATPWHRFECEEGILNAEAFINDDADCSGGQYVNLTSDQIEGSVIFNINVRDAGTYNMRYGQNAFDLERYEGFYVNDVLQVDNQFAGHIDWTAAAAIEGNNGWDDEAVIQDLFDSVELYGSEDGNWQVWSRFAEAWNIDRLNTTLTLDLEAGINAVEIRTLWGWDDWDYIELELGVQPKNPVPADGSIAVIADSPTLSWDNAVHNLDSIEVWFGETPIEDPNDPNTILSGDTYQNLLSLIHTETSPGESTSIDMPTIVDGADYTWVVDGLILGDSEPNNINYDGPFWGFYATDNAPPTADAGADQYTWLVLPDPNVVITLDGSGSSDDGADAPLTYSWTQIAGPAATIDTPDAMTTEANLTGGLGNNTEDGTPEPYQFQLEIYDGLWTRTDTVTIFVNSNSCAASIEAGSYYFYADIASAAGSGIPDCKVDLLDFAEMATNWLGCTNTFETCD